MKQILKRQIESKVLKNISAENQLEKNFEFLIEFKKTNFNLYYYFSILFFTLTFSLIVFSIFYDVFKKKNNFSILFLFKINKINKIGNLACIAYLNPVPTFI